MGTAIDRPRQSSRSWSRAGGYCTPWAPSWSLTPSQARHP